MTIISFKFQNTKSKTI